ncbi:hypothetical protein Q3G72_030519 [Acer saccharum]|nr:hypothetical protein Q3G72_030519 [Acer saccharum]
MFLILIVSRSDQYHSSSSSSSVSDQSGSSFDRFSTMAVHAKSVSWSSRTSNDPMNRRHHQHHGWQRTPSDSNWSTNTTHAAAATRAYKSIQLDRFSNQAVHSSKSSDDHQRFSTGRVSRSDQYHSRSSSSSVSDQLGSSFDGFSTMAVHGSAITKLDKTKPLRLHQLQTNSSSASSTSQPRLVDGHSTKAVHGSRSGNIKPLVRQQQHHRTSEPSLIDNLSTVAVHGSRSGCRFGS